MREEVDSARLRLLRPPDLGPDGASVYEALAVAGPGQRVTSEHRQTAVNVVMVPFKYTHIYITYIYQNDDLIMLIYVKTEFSL